MSLTSKIIFVSCMLPCAALCAWAAVAFGGPGATAMWVVAGLCVIACAVVFLINRPRATELEDFRVEGAREPTFRLVRSEPGAKGEVWQLVMEESRCALIRPDGTQATTFARKWAELAIRMPGFVNGELLGIVTEDWSPPGDEGGITPGELLKAARNIRHTADRDTPHYWFTAPKHLINEIDDYRSRTHAVLGAEAAGPVSTKARQCVLSGAVGLAIGIGAVLLGIVSFIGENERPANRRTRTLALGVVISAIGFWRVCQGIGLYRRAGRISGAAGPVHHGD